jgi:ABC-2 type transport system ATP-binding protein
MIEAIGLTKIYGSKTAVDDLSFTVRAGAVTGFLGPNGAGKSTTMRMIVGLDRPTHGAALVNGNRYADHAAPLLEVGALLDARAAHPGRSAYAHLLALATSNGIGKRRVREVLGMVGLEDAAARRVRAFSLGMSQRMGLAAALLGDPAVVLLDEPVNGLDPEGIHWIRGVLRSLAAEGRTVFVSSHLMSEMELTADRLLVVGKGRLLADVSMADMTASVEPVVRVRTTEPDRLAALLSASNVTVMQTEPGVLSVTGRSAAEVGRVAYDERVLVEELTPVHPSLEEAYLAMTSEHVEYAAGAAGSGPRSVAA